MDVAKNIRVKHISNAKNISLKNISKSFDVIVEANIHIRRVSYLVHLQTLHLWCPHIHHCCGRYNRQHSQYPHSCQEVC